MKHIIILDDNRKSNKDFMVVAKGTKGITIFNEKQFAAMEDEILYREMKKAEKAPLVTLEAFKKQMAKIGAKK